MTIIEETPEFLFIQHAVEILGVPNSRPDIAPGGLWVKGKIRISWGMRMATEPPTVQVGKSSSALNGNISSLPRDLRGRLAIWKTAWENRSSSTYRDLTEMDFRDIVILSAILSWEHPPEPDENTDFD